ncbi:MULTISPECIES: methylenetetrahydrofolate reductase [Psychrobacter]|uniref:Methylenetetrahydrofolate reductase n=1 Tax=Psychrobacter cryohalolentis (strain ATCC BAA-1226 / DSM 17306 / VKM B-2378 / K5) TaxID=335284 RepID=Q1QAS5_PSYCK|nr:MULTISPECIES: methylenetetrahydrofolate reductase [Psychrobacter]ABE75228.1 5,10-methylenetetrahydrofolate reductase (FADH) [Psychrobacter cryohalolentis K5]AGP49037.1 5,10-methylenetetrahydrofolate reductase [Psychrobacter sp. G]ASE25422.1 5,10-methylenetetrahydrofolate reductase [Psychrobacter cryohalolentis]
MTKPAFSFEFFPAKTEQGHEKLLSTYDELNKLSPAYFSVTYGAGGSTRSRTLDIVQALCARGETDIAPHMSCIGDDKSEIAELLEHYKSLGIKRLVALRGDLPSGQVGMGELPFALDLVKFIREHSGDHFHIEVAAYPEMHPQARSFKLDVDNLVNKYQAGANASITQFFYNADSYLYLRESLEKRGIDTVAQPLVAGIMPITNSSNLMRFADSCGADIPRYVRKQLADFGDDSKAIREFGFEVVYRLCERLISEGVPAMHFYSMNKVEPNKRLIEALGLIA